MAREYEISFRLGAQMAGNFAKTMANAGGALGELNDRIGDLSRQQSSIQSLVNLRRKVGESSREYMQASQRVAELGRAMSNTENPSREMTREFERAQRAVTTAKNRLNENKEALRNLNREMGTTGQSTRQLTQRQEELARASQRAVDAQQSLQQTLTAQQDNMNRRADLRGQLFDVVALGAAFAGPVRAAMQFESVMADVNKVVQQTEQQSAAMGQEIVRMSRNIPIAAAGIGEIVAAGGQAGIAREELTGFAESAAQMATAFDVSAGQAGEMMAQWRTAFRYNQEQTVALADQVNYLSDTTAAAAPKIADVVTRIGGLGEIAGLNSGQVAALGASLVAVGTPSEVAATSMQNMFLAMTKGESATAGQRAAFEALGTSAEDMARMMQQDAEGAIMSVLGSIRELSAEERPAVLNEIFGAESIKGIGSLLNNTEMLAENFAKVGDASLYAGSMQREFETRSQTTENQLQLMSNRVNGLAITIGSAMLPAINEVLAAIGPWIDRITDLATQYPQATTAIVGTVAALIAFKVAAIAGGYAFTFVRGAYLSVVAVLKTLRVAYLLATGATVANTAVSRTAIVVSKLMAGAQWLLNAALSANPIGLVIAGVVALVAAGIWMWKNWDKVTAFFSAAWDRIKSLFMNFHPLGLLIGNFEAVTNWLSGWWSSFTTFMGAGIDVLGALFSAFNPLSLIRGAFNSMLDWINNFSLFDSGAALLNTLADGIRSAVSGPVEAIQGGLARVREYLPFSDAKVGPLSQLTASGAAIMSTLSEGMSQARPTDMMRPFSATTGGMLNNLDTGVSGAVNRLRGASSGGGAAPTAGGGMSFTITQTINLPGGSGADTREQARQGAAAGADDLIERMRAAMQQERRLSYG